MTPDKKIYTFSTKNITDGNIKMGVKDVESGVMFHRTHGNRRTGKKEFEISDEYVKLQGKSQGVVVINFRASKKDLTNIYEFLMTWMIWNL